MTDSPTILVIDNYDSFVYILVQYLGELGASPVVRRHDEIDLDGIRTLDPDGMLISPGPGNPDDSGVSMDILTSLTTDTPIFGVCLGMQCMGQAFGGDVVRAPQVMHGKTSMIRHRDVGVFRGLQNPVEATRYHSLIVDRATLPDALDITAETDDGLIMGLRHRERDIEGVQFHPESVLTNAGHALITNFIDRCR